EISASDELEILRRRTLRVSAGARRRARRDVRLRASSQGWTPPHQTSSRLWRRTFLRSSGLLRKQNFPVGRGERKAGHVRQRWRDIAHVDDLQRISRRDVWTYHEECSAEVRQIRQLP